MEFATLLDRDDHAAALELLAGVTNWTQPKGREWFMGALKRDEHPLLAGCRSAFFLKVEPGGYIHKHVDAAADVFDADLIVVKTNDQSQVYYQDADGAEHSVRLESGKRYRMNQRNLLHWSDNHGDTDRVHLIIQYSK